jgi:hypothetical protein
VEQEVKKKYLCIAGYVESRNDGDRHFISAPQLARLYRVDPKECVFVNGDEHPDRLPSPGDMIILKPRFDGNYTIPEEWK